MTGPDLKRARLALGFSLYDMARALRLSGGREASVKHLRAMEAGARDVSGPVSRVVQALLDGWRPSGWPDLDA
jgi:transcriptional regulator with XRE-family HTH domain